MILNMFNSAEFLLKNKIVTLHMVTMYRKLVLFFWYDWKLMLNWKHKDLLKTEVPIQSREQTNAFWMTCKKWNTKKNSLNASGKKTNYGTTFLNPMIIIKKIDFNKTVLDAKQLKHWSIIWISATRTSRKTACESQ